jgi:hypothetical protein
MAATFVPALVGGTSASAPSSVVGTPEVHRFNTYIPGSEELAVGEIRVSILGSGLPW